MLQQEEKLREQLLLRGEWQSLLRSDSDIKQFARARLKKRSIHMVTSSSRHAGDAAASHPDIRSPSTLPSEERLACHSSLSLLSLSQPSLLLPGLSSSPHSLPTSSPPDTAVHLLSLPPPTELIVLNEVAELPGQGGWNALCPGLATMRAVGTLADGSCGQSTACQALTIASWQRAPSRRTKSTIFTYRHTNSAHPDASAAALCEPSSCPTGCPG